MENYKTIVVAVDLHENCDQAATEKAVALAKEHQAKLIFVHAVEHINAYGVAAAYTTIINVEEILLEQARKGLDDLTKKYKVADAEKIIEIGSPKMIIIDLAKKKKADLIVLGSHGRHGFGLLLGSTANAVLHNAPCDVLAVRVK